MEELWAKIEGFEDYMVSNIGEVKSFRVCGEGRILKPRKTKNDDYYYKVFLSNGKEKKKYYNKTRRVKK